MRILPGLALLLAPAPAAAERLGYDDVLGTAPRLGYATVAVGEEAEPIAQFYGDRIEAIPEGDGFAWDVSAEIGNGPHRLWLATVGDGAFADGLGYVEAQALYTHSILDTDLAVQAGVRRDFIRPRRTHAVLGVQGNVSVPLYLGAFGYLSTKGELTASAYAYYDWTLGNLARRALILQPYAAVDFAAEDMPELGLGSGATALELSARLRYRLAEPFAPYVGISYERLLGRTADLARAAGDEVDGAAFVLGIRSYF
jgi:copper resistance protein B